MKIIELENVNSVEEVVAQLSSDNPIAILEFPRVYGLIAANSLKGVQAINTVKKRLPNKFYGSMLGDYINFSKVIPNNLFQILVRLVNNIDGALLRFPVDCTILKDNLVTHNGTHQVLVENHALTEIMAKVDLGLQNILKKSDFFSVNFQAPIISSLNTSGHHKGSITNEKHAIKFGIENQVPLFIKTNLIAPPFGSYPIFNINRSNQITCLREGPNAEIIEQQLNSAIQSIN